MGPGRLCPIYCLTLPKPWAKWAILFISIYLTCLIYIIRYRLKKASIAYHMHISRHGCTYLFYGRQFIYPLCRNSCTARFARPSPTAVADPECARGGGVSHILAEKRGVSFTLFKNMHENSIFLPIMGGGVRRVRPMLHTACISTVCSSSNNESSL